MQPDEQPDCGEELLPDGTPAPILCTLPIHSRHVKHQNGEHKTTWRWQDAHGNWLSRPATDFPA